MLKCAPPCPVSALPATIDAQAHVILIGYPTQTRLALLGQVLDQIDQRAEPAFVYDPTGRLTRQYYTQAHGDAEITPLDLSSCSSTDRHNLYAALLTGQHPLGLTLVRPKSAVTTTWNPARWACCPRGWIFLTHNPDPRPAVLAGVSATLTGIAYRIATAPRANRCVWLVIDQPPLLPPYLLPCAELGPSLRDSSSAGLKLVLTLTPSDTLDTRYGAGTTTAVASQTHITLVLSATTSLAATEPPTSKTPKPYFLNS